MEVGDYVRTKEFGINRVDWFDNGEPILENGFTALQKGYKSSPNIIDLIEEGDLLKIEYYAPRWKERLTRLFEVEYKSEKYLTLKNAHCDFNLTDNKFRVYDKKLKPIIKSIVTKEQFESMEYKLGEDK